MSASATPLTVHRVDLAASATRTVDRIGQRLADGGDPTDTAVLARVASALLPVQVALTEAGIPHTAPLDTSVLGRTGVRTALAYLRLGLDLERIRRDDLLETLNRPARKVKSAVVPLLPRRRLSMNALERVADALGPSHQERFVAYLQDLRALESAITHGADTARCLHLIRRRIGLGDAVDALDASRSRPEGSSHGDDLDVLEQLAHLEPRPEEFGDWLADRLRVPGDPAGVTLATVHRVKGREWPHVLVVGASAGLFPHRLADDTEEERRVFHVAITRCQQTVDVIAESGRVSPFVDELVAPVADDVRAGASTNPAPRPSASPGDTGAAAPGIPPDTRAPRATDAAPAGERGHGPRFHDDGALVTTAGVAVQLPGGFDGHIRTAGDDHVAVRLLAGPTVHLPYGTQVTVAGRSSRLGEPQASTGPAGRSGGSGSATDRDGAAGVGPGRPAAPNATGDHGADGSPDDALFEALRRWRAEAAAEAGVPAYLVFHDRHLQLIAGRRPTSLRELADCPGVGPTKLERYGDDLLAVVAEYH